MELSKFYLHKDLIKYLPCVTFLHLIISMQLIWLLLLRSTLNDCCALILHTTESWKLLNETVKSPSFQPVFRFPSFKLHQKYWILRFSQISLYFFYVLTHYLAGVQVRYLERWHLRSQNCSNGASIYWDTRG